MTGKLVFALCEHYCLEAQAALAAETFDNAVVVTYPARCGRPPLTVEELSALLAPVGDVAQVELFGACCLTGLTDATAQGYDINIHKLEHCFNLVADPALTDSCLAKGAYLATPGWLANWPVNMQRLGVDRELAREMFSETATGIVLFETGVDNQSNEHLQAFARHVGRPCEIIYTGISALSLRLARAALSWQLEVQRRTSAAEIKEIRKQAATHAMAIDLLSNLARIVSEGEAVEAMLDVYMLLFAPRRVCYLSFQEGLPDKLWIRPDMATDDSEKETITKALAAFQGENGCTESGTGLILRSVRRGEARGVVAIEDIAFPEYLEHYLNLALSIVDICELPIENAREYEKLVTTEKMLKRANEELYQLSTTDSLTGIANRRAYDEYVETEWKRMVRNNTPLSLVVCDIDLFKKYNDSYGHMAGDICLRTVAQIIHREILRPGDFAARYGGEEFAVVLPDTTERGALHIAEKIRSAVVNCGIPHEASNVAPYVTLSLGVAYVMPPLSAELTPATLFSAADTALYQAKNEGRNRSVIQHIPSGDV